MICAKNYETVFKFIKVVPRILWLIFSGHGVYDVNCLGNTQTVICRNSASYNRVFQ